MGPQLGRGGLQLLLSGPDRPTSEGLVLVDKHTENGMLDGLISSPVLVFGLKSRNKRGFAEGFLLSGLVSGSIFE